MDLIENYISIDSDNYQLTDKNYHKQKLAIFTHDFWLLDLIIGTIITVPLYQNDRPINIVSSSDFVQTKFCANLLKQLNVKAIHSSNKLRSSNNMQHSGTVDKICQLLKNGENVAMAIERSRFFNSSGLFHIFNFINENNIDLDIIEISMLSKDKLDKINFTINKHIRHRLTNLISHHIFDILRFKDFSKNKKLYYKAKLHQPFSYNTKEEFMEKMYKSLYEIED